MRRPRASRFRPTGRLLLLAIALLTAGALVLAVVGPAVGHGNHATAHPQVSADGTIRLEEVFLTQDGYLVLHRDDDGQPGAVIGHRPIDGGLSTDVSVRVDPATWQNVSGNVTLWATVHASNGDDQFEPGEDPLLSWFGEPAGDRITVGKRGTAVAVLTRGGGPLESGQLPVTRVVFGQQGHVVIHLDDGSTAADGSLGRVVGHRTVAAGNHTDVRVPVSITPPAENESRRLRVVAYRDDGDGRFDEADTPVRVDDQFVASPYLLQSSRQTATVAIRTPSPTTARTVTATGETPTSTTGAVTPTNTTSADGAGLGAVATVVALVSIGCLLALRRR